MEEEEVEDREGEGGKDNFPTAAAFLSRTEVVATSNIKCSGSPDVTTCTSEAIRLSSLQIKILFQVNPQHQVTP